MRRRERELKEKLDKTSSENERLNSKNSHLEKQYNNLLQSNRVDIQEKNIKYERLIDG